MSENDIPRPQAEAVRALRADRDFLRGRVAHGLVGCAGAFVCLRAVETLPAWVTLLTCAAALVALLVLGTLWEYEWGPRIPRRVEAAPSAAPVVSLRRRGEKEKMA